MSDVVTQTCLVARSFAEFEPAARGIRQIAFSAGHHATKSKTASGRSLLFSPMDFDAEGLSRQEGDSGFILSCAAMKCGLASRKILTNAALVLPIQIERRWPDSAANTPPPLHADCFAEAGARD